MLVLCRRPLTVVVQSLSIVALGACDSPAFDAVDAGPAAIRDAAPPAPQQNDPAFVVEVSPYSLIGNALTAGHNELTVRVTAPTEVEIVDVWVEGAEPARLARDGDAFVGTVDVGALGPGALAVVLAADDSETAFAATTVIRTHPLYVLVGTDWDDADNTETSLSLQDELHARYPELKLTHFVGPYTFTDPSLSEERVERLVEWLKGHEAAHSDEVGVHIHPYCNFVETTDVSCRTQPSVVYDLGDASGYTVDSSSYTEEEYTALLLAADALFEAHGFDKPTSFRAGAWTAAMNTLRAVSNAGYTVDSNAYNWARMEEWIGLGNGAFYEWVSEHWSLIGDESQPYYPSTDDIQLPGAPSVPVLEVPLNGAMVDYVDGEEMIEIFDLNWDGSALTAPTTYVIGFHPSNYVASYQRELVEALDYVELFKASAGEGPVVYATFRELTAVWPRP